MSTNVDLIKIITVEEAKSSVQRQGLQLRCDARQQIFKEDKGLAWKILDAESQLHIQLDINLEKITLLISLYVRMIEQLNSKQDPRQTYFSFKMQKLMNQPYVIRCFTNQHEQKRGTLEHKRKELEQKLVREKEKHNHIKIIEKTMADQEQKQQKAKKMISSILNDHETKLQQRIKKRNASKISRASVQQKSPSLLISNKSNFNQSTCSPNLGSNSSLKEQNLEFFSSQFSLSKQIDEKVLRRIQSQVNEQQQIQIKWHKFFPQ